MKDQRCVTPVLVLTERGADTIVISGGITALGDEYFLTTTGLCFCKDDRQCKYTKNETAAQAVSVQWSSVSVSECKLTGQTFYHVYCEESRRRLGKFGPPIISISAGPRDSNFPLYVQSVQLDSTL